MTKNEELDPGPEFDDSECIKYILALIPEEDKRADKTTYRKAITEDDVQFVLDCIYDYYEQAGLIDEEQVSDSLVDENEELEFVTNACKEEGIGLTMEQIQLILDGEFQYGLEIGIYEESDED